MGNIDSTQHVYVISNSNADMDTDAAEDNHQSNTPAWTVSTGGVKKRGIVQHCILKHINIILPFTEIILLLDKKCKVILQASITKSIEY